MTRDEYRDKLALEIHPVYMSATGFTDLNEIYRMNFQAGFDAAAEHIERLERALSELICACESDMDYDYDTATKLGAGWAFKQDCEHAREALASLHWRKT